MPASGANQAIPHRLWVISELYYPEETSTGYFLTRIAEGLVRCFDVGAICGQPTYSARGIRATRSENHNGVEILRCAGTTFNKDIVPLRLLNLITLSLSICWKALWHLKRNNLVLVVTNPPTLPFLIWLAARIKRARCILLVHDVYPNALAASDLLARDSISYRSLDYFSSYLYRRMDGIVALGRCMRTLIGEKLAKENHQRLVTIPHWSDLDFIFPQRRLDNRLLSRLLLLEKFVVQYAGNIGRTHGVETLISTIELLQSKRFIHFLFIVSGGRKLWLRQALEERRLSTATVLDSCPRSELPDYLNACDVALISYSPGMRGVSVPSRLYNILAAGKPVIAVADPRSELALVVKEEGVGWVVPPDDAESLARAVLKASSDREALSQMGKAGRQAAVRRFAYERSIRAYCSLCNELL